MGWGRIELLLYKSATQQAMKRITKAGNKIKRVNKFYNAPDSKK